MEIKTAEEYLKEHCNVWKDDGMLYADYVTPKDLIEFAKMHVKAALEKASENAEATDFNGSGFGVSIDEDSIKNSYPDSLIK